MKPFWLLLLSSILGFAAQAKQRPAEHLSARLISEVSQAENGSPFLAGVEIKLEKGWHIYWQNPGDYGDAPSLHWGDHPDFEASEILWPVPKKIQVGTIVSFGYEDEVILPFRITPHLDSNDSKMILKPKLKWLVCKASCVPGNEVLTLEIPVSKNGVLQDSNSKPILDVIRNMLPRPMPTAFQLSGTLNAEVFKLKLGGLPAHTDEIGFFPKDGDDVNYSIREAIQNSSHAVEIQLRRSDRLINEIDHFPALLVLHTLGGETLSYDVDIPLRSQAAFSVTKILLPLLFAFLGGLLLNLMPCVFPVLSIKAMSVLKMSGEDQRNVRKMGWAYTFGILVSFWVLVATLIFLRLGGQQVGWGFQLQSPRFVFVLACMLFVFGLNLLGIFEFSGRFMHVGNDLTQKSGWLGSFFTGVLATVVATPCSAPFMGSAVGFALSQSSFIIFLIFSALGFGLALPYLLICYLPVIGKILPRPGAWMETFQQVMAFFIFGTILWLAWVLSLQVSSFGLVLLLSAFVCIGFAVWLHVRFHKIKFLGIVIGILVIVTFAISLGKTLASSQALTETTDPSSDPHDLQWEKFSPAKVSDYQAKGRPVFVDFTAAWCVSCQLNEALVFHSEAVKQKLKSMNFALLKGDWTNQDPVITKALQAYDRDGVPFYLIYPKGKDAPAVPLPEVINAGIVLNQLEKLK